MFLKNYNIYSPYLVPAFRTLSISKTGGQILNISAQQGNAGIHSQGPGAQKVSSPDPQ